MKPPMQFGAMGQPIPMTAPSPSRTVRADLCPSCGHHLHLPDRCQWIERRDECPCRLATNLDIFAALPVSPTDASSAGLDVERLALAIQWVSDAYPGDMIVGYRLLGIGFRGVIEEIAREYAALSATSTEPRA